MTLFSNTINYEIGPVFVSMNLFGIATPRWINSLNWGLFRSAFYMFILHRSLISSNSIERSSCTLMHYQIRTDIRASLLSSKGTGTIANSYAFGHLKWGEGIAHLFALYY